MSPDADTRSPDADTRSPDAGDFSAPAHAPQAYRRLARWIDVGTEVAIGLVANALVVFMVVALVYSVLALGYSLVVTFDEGTLAEVKQLVLGVLTVFIIIEIFDLFREYVRTEHIRILNLAEVSIAVVLRELWLKLLEGAQDWQLLIGLSVTLLAVAGLWLIAGGVEQRGFHLPLRRRPTTGD